MPDVPFVPTPQVVVDEMLRAAKVVPGDFVMDLGSGDGRIAITAARKFGARAMGVELNEHLIFQSEESARQAGVQDRVTFLQQDLFKTDLSWASVITMYLLPSVNRRLRPRLLDLKPGTRIVAHDFDLDDWKPDRLTTIRKNVFLWIVPAKVGGRWQLPDGELTLKQSYQMLTGTLKTGSSTAQITEGKLNGDRISFSAGGAQYTGQVHGDNIDGAVKGGSNAGTWSAKRVVKRIAVY